MIFSLNFLHFWQIIFRHQLKFKKKLYQEFTVCVAGGTTPFAWLELDNQIMSLCHQANRCKVCNTWGVKSCFYFLTFVLANFQAPYSHMPIIQADASWLWLVPTLLFLEELQPQEIKTSTLTKLTGRKKGKPLLWLFSQHPLVHLSPFLCCF